MITLAITLLKRIACELKISLNHTAAVHLEDDIANVYIKFLILSIHGSFLTSFLY